MAAAPLAAQSSPELVTHFYVDPHYGSDSNVGNSPGAPWNNPRCTNGCSTATNLCNPVDVALQSGAVLRNNPWPFKTINGPNGALASIPSGGLPYTSPVTGVTTRYVIIHLMPGLYARTNAFGSSPRNPDNGLKPNGEVFPIHLPKGVSIQGTSALNTVFCLGDGQNSGKGPAFEFGTGNATGEGTFIDSIAIYGALKDDGVGKDASAIYLSPNVASSPTITNCFFYGNVCGIGVEGDINAGKVHDGTKIFNNTFAYNKLGIWNGSKAPDSSGFHIGYSKLILVNNIFDLNPPPSTNNLTNYGHYPLGTNTAMEGIHPDDLLVLLGGGAFGNFNAYPRNTTSPFPLRDRFDRNIAFPPFPKTKPRNPLSGGVTPQPSSNLDIRDYTENPNNGTSGQRGILFVADLLYWWGQNNSSVSNFDYSPHDLRLAPGVGPYQANFSLIKTTVVNPLVNGGWAVDPNNFSLKMRNNLTMAHPPGYLPLNSSSQNTWPFHSWVFDAEGFGNPRIYAYAGTGNTNGQIFPQPTGAGRLPIDLGADELGELLVAGYRFGTTMFMGLPPNGGVSKSNNIRAFFFVPRTGMSTGPLNGTVPQIPGNIAINKPMVRVYGHLYNQSNPPANYQYGTGGVPPNPVYPWFSTWSFDPPSTYYSPEAVDTTPHLLDDLHPWWTTQNILWTFYDGYTQTIHSQYSNPIWQECISAYNLVHYLDPSINRIHFSGTYKGGSLYSSTQVFQWLDMTWTNDQKLVNGNLVPDFITYPWSSVPNGFGRPYSTFQTSTDGKFGIVLANTSNPNQPGEFDLFPHTFKSVLYDYKKNTVVHYSLEKYLQPFFSPNLADNNLQSFDVVVWKKNEGN